MFEIMLGQCRVLIFFDCGEEYDVIFEGEELVFCSLNSIENFYVCLGYIGQLILLDNLLSFIELVMLVQLNCYNCMCLVMILVNLVNDYFLGEVLDYFNNIVEIELLDLVLVDYKGEFQFYQELGNLFIFVFLLVLFIMYFILVVQFESWVYLLVIMMIVLLVLFGVFIGIFFVDMILNIYSQIGFVMFIGLVVKNGIFIVEFVNQFCDVGEEFELVLCKVLVLCFCLIVMIGFIIVFSSIFLVLVFGLGVESCMVIGMVIFVGVLVLVFLILYIVFIVYYWMVCYIGLLLKCMYEFEKLDVEMFYVKGE